MQVSAWMIRMEADFTTHQTNTGDGQEGDHQYGGDVHSGEGGRERGREEGGGSEDGKRGREAWRGRG